MIYVIIQFTSAIFLLINMRISMLNLLSFATIFLACIMLITALINMKVKNLHILPSLKTHHILITHGIYKYIRHPMYSGLLILMLAILFSNLNYLTLSIYVLLFVNLTLKAKREEYYLRERFNNYQNYQKQTGIFLPKIFFKSR